MPYPDNIHSLISRAAAREKPAQPCSSGQAAAFLCGVSIRFYLVTDDASNRIVEAGFTTNGCGYAVAVAEALADRITGSELASLDGLSVLEDHVSREIGEAPDGRHHCFDVCFDALQSALAEIRKQRVDEWNGDDALICSCFGVSEGRISEEIAKGRLQSITQVGSVCRAGTGCGSCQPVIQEILDDLGHA